MSDRISRSNKTVRLLVAAWFAALVPGIGGGVVAAAIASATEAVRQPSPAGLLDIVLVGTLVGVVAGFPFLLLRARIPVRGAWVGAVWGGLVLGAVVAVLPPATRSALVGLAWTTTALAIGLSALLFLAWGLALEKAWARIVGRPTDPPLELHSSDA